MAACARSGSPHCGPRVAAACGRRASHRSRGSDYVVRAGEPAGSVPTMDLRIFTEPQEGATYDDLLAVARCAEDAGYDAFFRSDHFLAINRSEGSPGPTDACMTL